MHLLDQYSLATSSIVGKPYILEKYFPLPYNKYVVFAPFSKPSKNYSYYQDVLDILRTILKENGIEIVQVGAAGEHGFQNCYHTQGRTSLNNVYHILKNSLLYFGADTYAQHFSSAIGIPSVILISNNFSNNVRGYWNRDKQIILEPDRTKRNPSFVLDEGPNKQIDEIKAENIAKAICQLLNLPFNYPYETIYTGETYKNKLIEMVPDSVTNISNLGIDSIIIRLDYLFNEDILTHQMGHCPVTVVTNRPIKQEILQYGRGGRIKQLCYIVDKDNNVEFAKSVIKNGIPLSMVSYLSEEELNKFKLDFLDVALITRKDIKTKNSIKEIEGVPPEKLFYKSSKITLSQGKIFLSKSDWLEQKSVATVNQIAPISCSDEWLKDLEYFTILKEK